MISFLYQKLWVIQFLSFVWRKYWEYVMLNWENKNTSRMIRGKNMKFSRDLSNKNTSKVLKFGVWSIHSFWVIKSSPLGLTGLKLMSTIFHISPPKIPLWVKLWKMFLFHLKCSFPYQYIQILMMFFFVQHLRFYQKVQKWDNYVMKWLEKIINCNFLKNSKTSFN